MRQRMRQAAAVGWRLRLRWYVPPARSAAGGLRIAH
jgi:hypothetical protein